jgi:carbon storage regulator
MLVLSRNVNQSIRISDNITITLLEIRGDRAKLGIVADRTVPVLRGELVPDVQAAIERQREQQGEQG